MMNQKVCGGMWLIQLFMTKNYIISHSIFYIFSSSSIRHFHCKWVVTPLFLPSHNSTPISSYGHPSMRHLSQPVVPILTSRSPLGLYVYFKTFGILSSSPIYFLKLLLFLLSIFLTVTLYPPSFCIITNDHTDAGYPCL